MRKCLAPVFSPLLMMFSKSFFHGINTFAIVSKGSMKGLSVILPLCGKGFMKGLSVILPLCGKGFMNGLNVILPLCGKGFMNGLSVILPLCGKEFMKGLTLYLSCQLWALPILQQKRYDVINIDKWGIQFSD